MSGKYISTSAIGDLLGHTTQASTRKWILRSKLTAARRDTDTGEKLYLRAQVDAKIAEMPGRGARTDLKEPPRDHDRDRPPLPPD